MNYHDDTSHLTKTALNVFCDSPVEYYHQFVSRQMPRKQATAEMIDGTVLHSIFLERKQLDDIVGIYPESCINKTGGLIGVTAKKHRLANPDKFWMKAGERDRIDDTFKRLKDSAIADAIAECSHYEKEMRANVYGTDCKCKPDIAGDVGEYWMVYDLKFTENIRSFPMTSRKLRYWLQDAHYSAVIRELTGKPVVFKFIAAETVFPYRVAIFSYNEIKREMASKYHKAKVLDLQACIRSGDWRDKFNEDLPLSEWDCECGEVLWTDDTLDDMNQAVESDETEVMEDMPF